jgi:hypothetical protein
MIVIFLAVTAMFPAVYYGGSIWKWAAYHRYEENLGQELGLEPHGVRQGFWVGQTDRSAWEKIPREVRVTKGKEILRKAVEAGFEGLEIQTRDGSLVAVTVRRKGIPEWVIVETEEHLKPSVLGVRPEVGSTKPGNDAP